ncbi:N-acetylmuramoyl-L-alanine amidase [Clostridium sp. 'White wine YQ']|uniref:N-acetylmuramoyl-L-alanine amidase n=1 Tax=Clostridium sp. 'White wine YQ' TaxID=3027474 RepID=UPI002365376E|nr:N-acetylmuramoyl-L-alanine amidase [Clostridium sp. 'White wine YQ']MDD7792911.1 N-acetylmuramoyl-L-alanine amidase [Clostridium sp. 'White wine YQ']
MLSKGSIISGDAGHNAYPDTGAIGIRIEDNCTKDVWKAIMLKLNDLGYLVKDCTPWDQKFTSVNGSLGYRVKEANSSGSALHLCIHFNIGGGTGVEAWISGRGGQAEVYANEICSEMNKIGYYNRGVKVGNLFIPKYTSMPCVLVECAFLDSKEDMNRYNVNSIANAIVKAVTGSTSNANYDPSGSNPSTPTSPSTPGDSGNTNNYTPNARVRYDWLYVRDAKGEIIPNRRVDIGDKIKVLDVSYSRQLAYIIYPTPTGSRYAYVKVGGWIQYLNPYNATILQDLDVYSNANGSVIGRVFKDEKVTILEEQDSWLNIVYTTDKGEFTKSGWVKKELVKY